MSFLLGFGVGILFMLVMNWNAWWWYEGRK